VVDKVQLLPRRGVSALHTLALVLGTIPEPETRRKQSRLEGTSSLPCLLVTSV